MPTVEQHRQKNPYVSTVELVYKYGVKDILIGDSKAHYHTLQYMQAYMENREMHIPVVLTDEGKKTLESSYNVRRDLSETVVRLLKERVPNIEIKNNNARLRGSITIENKLSGRYSGEIQITKKDFPMDARTNVLGFIHPDYVELVDYIDRDTQIKFVVVN